MSVSPTYPTHVLEYSGAADSFVVTTNNITALDFWVTNQDVATRYLQAFDATSLPSNGATPKYSVAVLSGLTAGHAFDKGVLFGTGLVLALSTTADVLTVTTGGQGLFGAKVRGTRQFGDFG